MRFLKEGFQENSQSAPGWSLSFKKPVFYNDPEGPLFDISVENWTENSVPNLCQYYFKLGEIPVFCQQSVMPDIDPFYCQEQNGLLNLGLRFDKFNSVQGEKRYFGTLLTWNKT